MRIASLTGAVVLATLAAAAPAIAQDGERYTLEKSPDGHIRMDRRSGEMSICREQGGQLVCKLAADERSALQDEIERLQSELDMLEERVSALEIPPRQPPLSAVPDEDSFDQAMGLMERFFRRFMGIVKELERDFDDPEPGTPQKT